MAMEVVVPRCGADRTAPTGPLKTRARSAQTTDPAATMGDRAPSVPRLQVVAHRGASFENAEHTLGAYLKALDAGADGLARFVRLTADGHLVCVHDRDLRRTA